MRYLVTGGAGFVGSHLVDLLLARDERVLILDDFSTGCRENILHDAPSASLDVVEGSVLDDQLVDDCMKDVDFCFHLASAVGVQLIVDRPLESLLNNVRGCDIVIGTAARHGKPLVFTSTSEVYGKNGGEALNEDADRLLGSPFKARWGYATAKSFGEALVHGYSRECASAMIATRLFNVVGPRQNDAYGMVLPRLVRQALAGDELTVYGNGTQSRCFMHVLDAVQALVLLAEAENASGKVYNVGSGAQVAIIELARRVLERTGSDSRVCLVPYDQAYGDGFEELGRRVPDTSRIESMTNWTATRTLDNAIDDLIVYEQSRSELLNGNAGSGGAAVDVGAQVHRSQATAGS